MPDFKDFETALMKRLSADDLDKTFLKTTSNSIMALRKSGLMIDQVYVKGRPRPDYYIINGKVDPDFWKKFVDIGGVFKRFEVFPYGIINPEGFKFEAKVNF